MLIEFRTLKTEKLSKKNILQICKLKDFHWKFGLQNQISWFNKNIKKNDLHNLLYIKKDLAGYTSLRKGYYNYSKNKKKNFLLFDTLILNPKYRKKGMGNLMMRYNNFIITKEKKPSFLVCKKNLIKFYRLNNWRVLPNNKYKTMYKSFNLNAMTFELNKIKTKIYLNLY